MCGRYALYSDKIIGLNFKIKIEKNYNISPNQEVVIIDEDYKVRKFKWGIKPEWKDTSIINARNETLKEKKTFKYSKKCVFIADGYYEWMRHNSGIIPYYHYLENNHLFFGGVYDNTGCCIVTKASAEYLSKIYKRQPFFLNQRHIQLWIENKEDKINFDEIINFHPVSRAVNSVWVNTPELIKEAV